MTRTATATLLRQLQTGGELDASEWDKVIVVDTAAEANVLLLVADCDRARSRSAVLRAIARAVDAPEFFGNDFDALYDCLCDASSTRSKVWCCGCSNCIPAIRRWPKTLGGSRPFAPMSSLSPARTTEALPTWSSMPASIPILNPAWRRRPTAKADRSPRPAPGSRQPSGRHPPSRCAARGRPSAPA